METAYNNLKTKDHKNGEIEFSAEISAESLKGYTEEAVGRAARDFQMDGFRKGKVPLHLVRPHLDDAALFETVVESALRDAVRGIVVDQKLSTLGVPQISITEAKQESPITFTVRFALAPAIELPDYRNIGREIFGRKDEVTVTDEEIQNGIDELRRMLASVRGAKEKEAVAEAPLPEINDETIKQFGNFKDVNEFREELKRQLAQEKELSLKEAKREEVIEKIVKESDASIPKMLIDQEWQKATEERASYLEKAGLSFEDYLKQAKKTEKELEKEGRAFIEHQVKTSLVFRDIQDRENLSASDKEVKANMAYLTSRYPDRETDSLRKTAESFVIQEKLFDLLSSPETAEEGATSTTS